MPEKTPQQARVRIESLAYGGDGIAHLEDGRVAFVGGTCPGDLLEVAILEDKGSFVRAETTAIVESSPARVAAPCPYFGACGGCQWQHVPYPLQLEAKRDAVADALRRIGRFENAEVRECLASPREYGYRNKIELVPDPQSQRISLGFHRARSDAVVPVEECLLLPKRLKQAPRALQGALRYAIGDELVDVLRIGIRVGANTPDVEVAVWTRPGPFPRKRAASTLGSALKLSSIVRVMTKGEGAQRKIAGVENLSGAGYWTERLGDHLYSVSAPSFFQVNTLVAEQMVTVALDALDVDGSDRVVDVFAGAGTFTLPLAEVAGETLAVEAEGAAVRDLRRNAEAADVDVDVLPGDAARVLAEIDSADAVLLDPPRSGLQKQLAEQIAALRPTRMVYVSCDPPTLARDLAALVAAGYALDWVQPLDLFPQSWHVESIARLTRS